MSGDLAAERPVRLVGPVMLRLVAAIPEIQALLEGPVIIGGLAVIARLGAAHRATQDLDALRHRAAGEPSGIELLTAAGAGSVDAVGAVLTTERGPVRVDVLDAEAHAHERAFTDDTDRLEATAHRWALDTASPMTLEAVSVDGSGARETAVATVLVARTGPLVAMKLKASEDRGAEKLATDLLDIIRLVTDVDAAREVIREFASADAQLRSDCAQHARRQLRGMSARTRSRILRLNVPGVDGDLIDSAADILEQLLGPGDSEPASYAERAGPPDDAHARPTARRRPPQGGSES